MNPHSRDRGSSSWAGGIEQGLFHQLEDGAYPDAAGHGAASQEVPFSSTANSHPTTTVTPSSPVELILSPVLLDHDLALGLAFAFLTISWLKQGCSLWPRVLALCYHLPFCSLTVPAYALCPFFSFLLGVVPLYTY